MTGLQTLRLNEIELSLTSLVFPLHDGNVIIVGRILALRIPLYYELVALGYLFLHSCGQCYRFKGSSELSVGGGV